MINYETDWSAPTCDLLIYSTPEPTQYKVPCLMEDHTYRMGIVWQNSSYNQPPHLGYSLAETLGVNRATYKTQTQNHAPEEVIPPAPTSGEEKLDANSSLTAVDTEAKVYSYSGTSFSFGSHEELQGDKSGNYVKLRTNKNGDTWTFNVNEGYVITSFNIDGYSNNSVATASITATSVKVDGTEKLTSSHVFGPGSSSASSVTISDISAKESIVVSFDNSNIGTEAGQKNKQIMSIITVTYEKVTGVENINADEYVNEGTRKFVSNGVLYIVKDGRTFTAAGQLVK